MSVPRLILFLAAIALSTPAFSAAAQPATIAGISRIYLRSGPATTYTPNGLVSGGENVEALERVGNWYRIQTADGRTGFVYSGYLTFGPSGAPPPPEAAVATAEGEAPPLAESPPPGAAPEPSAAPGAESDEAWQEELASLKAEVARLRSEVGGHPPADVGGPASAPALTLPTRVPVEISPNSNEATNLRTAGVAVFFLVVGWVFGAGFARRRSRSQRGRLRF